MKAESQRIARSGGPKDVEPLYVLYDGECATCHRFVRFLLARPRREKFRFLPLAAFKRSVHRESLEAALGEDSGESVVVVRGGEFLARSAALLAILAELGFPWSIGLAARFVPRFVRDAFYNAFARNRYRLFGRAHPEDICALVEPEARHLLLAELPQD